MYNIRNAIQKLSNWLTFDLKSKREKQWTCCNMWRRAIYPSQAPCTMTLTGVSGQVGFLFRQRSAVLWTIYEHDHLNMMHNRWHIHDSLHSHIKANHRHCQRHYCLLTSSPVLLWLGTSLVSRLIPILLVKEGLYVHLYHSGVLIS